MNQPEPSADKIADAILDGKTAEAIRLIAKEGVWTPFRDPGYFDTETCFPVFSSLNLIPPFLRQRGLVDEAIVSIKAHQVGPELFAWASHLEKIVVVNPVSDSEWKLTPGEFRALVGYKKRG